MKTPRNISISEPFAATNRVVAELLGTAINLLQTQSRALSNFGHMGTGIKRRADRTLRASTGTRRKAYGRRNKPNKVTTIQHAGTAKRVAA